MIKVAIFSYANKVKGQGVGSSYEELLKVFSKYYTDKIDIVVNSFKKSDISHYYTINMSFYISTFFRKKRGIMIGHVHFLPETLNKSINLPKVIFYLLSKYVISFYKRMDKLVVVNPAFIPKLEKLGINPNKITYIPNFVSSDEFYIQNKLKKKQLKRKLGIKNNMFTIIGVGQIQTRKGIDDFIKLAYMNPNIQFIWVGGFSFGAITNGYKKYNKLIKNKPHNLLFTGIIERENMANYYNIADLFFLPSFNELFPMSILEACNCGLPIMLRDLTIYKDILMDNYLKGNNIEDWNTNIRHMVTEPQILNKYQKKSKIISQYYSSKKISEKWFNIYVNKNS
ncbi:TPA: glycosyltransferase family 4 protein [Enterococcus faecium]